MNMWWTTARCAATSEFMVPMHAKNRKEALHELPKEELSMGSIFRMTMTMIHSNHFDDENNGECPQDRATSEREFPLFLLEN